MDTTINDGAYGERDGKHGEGFSCFETMQCQPPEAFIKPSLIKEFLNTPDMQYLLINSDIMWNLLTNSQELSNIGFDPRIVS